MAEIAIIGAGPAGLACAIFLAQHGVDVVVFEAKALPIDKPCGEGLMPEGVDHLHKLGAFKYLDKAHATPFNGVCFINERGQRATSLFQSGHGLGCRRIALSHALYAQCQEFSSIRIVRETVSGVTVKKNSVVVSSQGSTYPMRLVIAADGLRSRVRTWAGLDGESCQVKRYGLRRHISARPWNDKVEVYFRPGIEAYITPCGSNQTNIAFLWRKDLLPNGGDRISFESLIALFPDLARRARGVPFTSEQMAIGPLHKRTRDVITDGIALLGDSSGYYDAITGEGISIAFQEAFALARVVERACSKRSSLITRHNLLAYAREHHAITKAYYRNTALLLWFARNPRLMSTMISLGEMQPKAFGWMIEASRRRLRLL